MASGNEKLELSDGVETFDKAARDSGDSGEMLLIETQNLGDAVMALRDTFKGSGATAYQNFMVKVGECQQQLIDALTLINQGQGELYKAYSTYEDTQTADGDAAASGAELPL